MLLCKLYSLKATISAIAFSTVGAYMYVFQINYDSDQKTGD